MIGIGVSVTKNLTEINAAPALCERAPDLLNAVSQLLAADAMSG
jgi:hypothetical protein